MMPSGKKRGRPSNASQSVPSISGLQRNVARKSTAKPSQASTSSRSQRISTPARASPSSPLKAKKEEEIEKFAHECAYFCLIEDKKKYPIKRADIVSHVLNTKSSLYSTVIKRANQILQDTFGIRLDEVPDMKDNYILLCKGTCTRLDSSKYLEPELQQRGLLFLILSAIHLNSAPVSEDKLEKMLAATGVSLTISADQDLGDVKKLITQEWVKQLYLKRQVVPNSDPAEYEYTWGYRASREVDVSEINTFYRNVTGAKDPDDFLEAPSSQ